MKTLSTSKFLVRNYHNHNDRTNWFFSSVFHDPIGRWSVRTHEVNIHGHEVFEVQPNAAGVRECFLNFFPPGVMPFKNTCVLSDNQPSGS